MVRTFAHFPENAICPMCGCNNDRECLLIGIDGTQEDRIIEAAPTHVQCLLNAEWRFNKTLRVIYTEM